jgi:predicted transcriptional regulator
MARPKKYEGARITTAIRIPEGLHSRLQDVAEARDTSINHLMVKAAAYYLDNVLRPLEPAAADTPLRAIG